MYSKRAASQLRQEFWTSFGRYMQPVSSASGESINWVNYRTGARHIHFRMEAGKGATIAVELTHPAEAFRLEYFEKFLQLKHLLHQVTGENWEWEPAATDEHGKPVSRIFRELQGVHVFNREDWPALISFFKQGIIALDTFWNEVKHEFEVW
ncbi:MAG TPA: DUF4268 domain-containing protein [Chitinophagaceae bacterium]